MAMKLNAQEKATDSLLRSYNKQIEKAYRTLGYDNTITRNLVSQAKSIFGSNMKEMKITAGYSPNQIDRLTGEIHAIPQIARNRQTVNMHLQAKGLQAEVQYTKGEKKGQYKAVYDVTRAHQKAIKQAESKVRANIPPELLKTKNSKKIQDFIKKNMTQDRVSRQILENDLASEVFDAYTAFKNDSDALDDSEAMKDFQQFAQSYHNGDDIDLDLLQKIARDRQEFLLNLSESNPDLELNITESNLLEHLDEFETLLELGD